MSKVFVARARVHIGADQVTVFNTVLWLDTQRSCVNRPAMTGRGILSLVLDLDWFSGTTTGTRTNGPTEIRGRAPRSSRERNSSCG